MYTLDRLLSESKSNKYILNKGRNKVFNDSGLHRRVVFIPLYNELLQLKILMKKNNYNLIFNLVKAKH